MSDRECKECGYKALVDDDGIIVCVECSTIQSEDRITSEHQDLVGYQASTENLWIKYDKNKSSNYQIPRGKLSGQRTIRLYGKIFSFAPDMVTNAENMFNKLFDDPDLIYKTCSLKLNVGLACLYIVGRRYHKTVSLKKFCQVTDVPVGKLVQSLKFVTNKLSIELPPSSFIEIAVETATEHNIKRDVLTTAIEILHICDKAWLTTGRLPQRYIWMAFFIASKSLDIAGFQKVSYKKFLEKYNLKKHDGAPLNKTLHIMTDLGSHIPWACHRGKEDFVFYNLKDILKYSDMVMADKKKKLLDMLDESETQKRKLSDEEDIYQPPAFKYRKSSPVVDTENDSVSIFADTESLGSDIEEELDSLIRSEKEVIEIEKAREMIIDK